MFVLLAEGLPFAAEVAITLPGGGEPSTTLLVVFRHRGNKAFQAIADRAKSNEWNDLDVVRDIVCGWGREPDAADDEPWRGPVGADGEPEPFSLEKLEELCDQYPRATVDLWDAYVRARRKGRQGN